jgi:hypothetical protein
MTRSDRRAVRAALSGHGGKLLDIAADVAGGETVIFKLPGCTQSLAFRVGDTKFFAANFADMLQEITRRPAAPVPANPPRGSRLGLR